MLALLRGPLWLAPLSFAAAGSPGVVVKILGTAVPQFSGDGTGYVYPATPEEQSAAALLQEAGWLVSEPRCPLCRGMGSVDVEYTSHGKGTNRDPIRYDVTSKPCPNGCPTPAMYF